jgi:protocatechuate 3,4-dioxygenase beta subunit
MSTTCNPIIHRQPKTGRRAFLAAMAAGGIYFTQRGAFAQALVETPAQTEGPYYPDRLPLDQDNDLLLINDAITPGVGTVSWLSGRVLDRTGSPIRGAQVEIWQADNYGSYIHSQGVQNGQRDGNFQGYGRFLTASDGRYLFRTIKPGLYTGRVRHVHCKVTVPGGQSLTTQLYIDGETSGNDGVLNGIRDAAQRASVIRPWTPITGSPIGALAVTWDVVMGLTLPETAAAARPTVVSMAGVTHGATLRAGAAQGSWVTIFGDGFSSSAARQWQAADIVNGQLPQSLAGVSVRINNQPAAIQYVSQKQLNVLAPDNAPDADVQLTVTNSAGTSDAVTVNFRRFSPGFFELPDQNAAAVRSTGALIGPAGLIDSVTSAPARPGEQILLYGTGFGPTSPAADSSKTVTAPAATANRVRVWVDNKEADVAYAGLISPGLYQVNITVPDLANGDYPVTAEVGGTRTAKIVKLRVERAASAANVATPFGADRAPYDRLLRQMGVVS